MPGARLALLTCEALPEPDPDEAITLQALAYAGYDVTMLAWDAPSANPGAFDACILRSTWNYIWHVPAFLAWLERAARASRLWNGLDAVRWNLHKRYLSQLEQGGLAVTPTCWYRQGEPAALEEVQRRGWHDIVIKPAVSAASFATRRFRPHEHAEALAFLASLLAERDVMIQPYVATVEVGGERSLVWIDGALSHAVVKQPRFSADQETVSEALTPTPAERDFAERALALVPGPVREQLLYARVDVFADGEGGLLLSELELIEPSLFLEQHPPALAALVAAIDRRMGQRSA
jgi:hypothetical protein